MQAARFHQHGEPNQVLRMEDVATPEPGPGQVRVRMLLSPVNPSDLLVVRGEYGALPNLPATPGYEGVGIVEKSGGGLYGKLMVGKRVAVLNRSPGNWAEYVVLPAQQAFPFIPKALPDEQVATLFVNPATSYILITDVLKVPRGAWLLQTAAGSSLGKMVIRLGRHFGFKTINVVRRSDTAAEIQKLEPDAIIDTSKEDLEERVAELTGGQGVAYALDAVGGETGSKVVRCLGAKGKMVIYGALAMDQSIQVSARRMITGSKTIQGFWLSDWARSKSPLKMLMLLRKVGRLINDGLLMTDIAETFPLAKVADAVAAAETPGRMGKILLRLGNRE